MIAIVNTKKGGHSYEMQSKHNTVKTKTTELYTHTHTSTFKVDFHFKCCLLHINSTD